MGEHSHIPQQILLLLPVLLLVMVGAAAALTRHDFPQGFIFGASSSAYQIEGAAAEDGRKPSIWDTFTHAGYRVDKANADITADQYHKYKEDVKLMHDMGLDAYKFSIAWPRLIPDGNGAVNPKGLEYYNNLIDELISHGIQPHVTIYHFDLPQALQDEYSGLLSPKFIEDYTAYADVCFKNFGDRVKHWVTVNEPNIEPIGGYDVGVFPPRRCSHPFGSNCTGGNSTTEPYVVAHHLLLAHASAVSLYRDKYQAIQGGQIGVTLLCWWFEPATQSPEDIAAAARMNDFHIGWIMHPLVYGDYPPVMRRNAGSRLPSFTMEESEKVRGAFDFVGFNHYSFYRVRADLSKLDQELRDYMADTAVKNPFPFIISEKVRDGGANYLVQMPHKCEHLEANVKQKQVQIGLNSPLVPSAPWALSRMLEHLKLNYGNPPVVIHENGVADQPDYPSKIEYDDDYRSEFLQDYIEALIFSIRNGSNARGYFVWSFLDCFEFLFGYKVRFGINGVDLNAKERTRYVRHSARWYSSFLKGGELRPDASGKAYVA